MPGFKKGFPIRKKQRSGRQAGNPEEETSRILQTYEFNPIVGAYIIRSIHSYSQKYVNFVCTIVSNPVCWWSIVVLFRFSIGISPLLMFEYTLIYIFRNIPIAMIHE